MHMHVHVHAHMHMRTCMLMFIQYFTLSDVVSDVVPSASWEAAAEGLTSDDGMEAAAEILGAAAG